MKKTGLTLSLAFALCTNALAHGHLHVWGCWPPFSIGIGLGTICGWSLHSCPAYCYHYSYPAYSCAYSPPSYASAPPANYVAPAATVPSPRTAPAPSDWVPSTPGAGEWVPDPTPYRYTPPVAAKKPVRPKAAPAQMVTVTRSPEGIPVYIISHLK